MSARNDVAPSTLGIELLEYGVQVEYLDGRRTVYRGVPKTVTDALTTGPGKETHVLVTDPTETEGVMLYVNDLKTHDDILEDTGVGRIILQPGEEEEVFPGVTVRRAGGQRNEIEADPEIARGRVFVFVEDDWGEESFEFVSDPNADGENADGDEGDRADGDDGDE
ncbi:DUF5796 family protein [Halegenticoccus tardaugens]|uniref:DUF5796 family protein n=1 Tax=Halegenticoccus tardaugens TaxID=2071624 RepID=UPI00100B67BA|nr:DUF5796 family protein [Halegenticoccus tardaugens]